MNLVTVNVDSIRLGQPLPFTLRDEGGVLLASKGYVVRSRADLDQIIRQRGDLFIDVAESESYHRAYVGKLRTLVNEDRTLGKIAGAQLSASDLSSRRAAEGGSGEPDWLDLQGQAHAMLRDSNPASFQNRLDKLQAPPNRPTPPEPDRPLVAPYPPFRP